MLKWLTFISLRFLRVIFLLRSDILEIQRSLFEQRRSFQAFILVIVCWLLFFDSSLLIAQDNQNLGERFSSGYQNMFSQDKLPFWIGGLGLAGLVSVYDQDITDSFNRKKEFHLANSIGDIMGTGVPGALLGLGIMGWGAFTENSALKNSGQSHIEALVATAVSTIALKGAIGRRRPVPYDPEQNNQNRFNSSLPSGHTSTAFATAGYFLRAEGWKWGLPMLALATVTGYSRVQQQVHFTSDVIAGATLGFISGLSFAKSSSSGIAELNWRLLPVWKSRGEFHLLSEFQF